MRVDDEQVTFNVFNALRYPDEVEECSVVNIVDSVVSEQFHKKYNTSVMKVPSLEGLEEQSEYEDAQMKWLETKQHFIGQRRQLESSELPETVFKPPWPSIEESPIFELKPPLTHLHYVYLGDNNTLPVSILVALDIDKGKSLIEVLEESKKAIGWTITDIKEVSPFICLHESLLEEYCSNTMKQQRSLKLIMKKVVKKEVIKCLDVAAALALSKKKNNNNKKKTTAKKKKKNQKRRNKKQRSSHNRGNTKHDPEDDDDPQQPLQYRLFLFIYAFVVVIAFSLL